jgi:hypothetical protein
LVGQVGAQTNSTLQPLITQETYSALIDLQAQPSLQRQGQLAPVLVPVGPLVDIVFGLCPAFASSLGTSKPTPFKSGKLALRYD